MASLALSLQKLTLAESKLLPKFVVMACQAHRIPHKFGKIVTKPEPGVGKAYRRIVHFPENYTVKPLEVTNLAGRDPVTGRVVAKGIGGGIKHKYHWIDWKRVGPKEGPPQEERVIKIMEDGCRTANIALVAVGDKLKYILATVNMKAGDLLKTSCHIPRIPGMVGNYKKKNFSEVGLKPLTIGKYLL